MTITNFFIYVYCLYMHLYTYHAHYLIQCNKIQQHVYQINKYIYYLSIIIDMENINRLNQPTSTYWHQVQQRRSSLTLLQIPRQHLSFVAYRTKRIHAANDLLQSHAGRFSTKFPSYLTFNPSLTVRRGTTPLHKFIVVAPCY